MFGLFKKKSKKEKLQENYKKLMEQAFELSKKDRMKSDAAYAEADELLKEIDKIEE